MKNTHIRLILLNIFLIILLKGTAQEININILSEDIKILNDSSYQRNISVTLKGSNEIVIYPIFYDLKLEEVSDIKVYIKKGNRYKLEKKPLIKEEDIGIDYISSRKVKSIYIPSETEAKITYTINCDELMYFSDIRFFSYEKIDTMKYQITIPDNYQFLHDIIYADSLNYYTIDSSRTENAVSWKINVVPVKVKPNPLIFFGIYRNLRVPLMRTIVVPSDYKNKAKEYLNDWYLNELETKTGLDSVAKQKIDELTAGISDPMKIVDTIFNYVKTNFKYVAIEIGMGAFIPTAASEVFTNKHGDCKDLSNFLSEALSYKGIKSCVALAATYDYISDCDFPSLGSANHVICVAFINGKTILLDSTDPIHQPNTPVESIQGRSILIINPGGGDFYKLQKLPPSKNTINYKIELKTGFEGNLMEGDFYSGYSGISGNYLRRAFLDLNENEINTAGKNHYENIFGNQTVTDFSINMFKDSIQVKGELSVDGKIFDDANSRFIFLDFLPRLIESRYRETLLEGTYLGNTIDKKVNIKIKLDKPYEKISPRTYNFSNKGVALNLEITNPTDFLIECNYEFILDYIYIDKVNIDYINEILKSFNKLINEPIILKSKD